MSQVSKLSQAELQQLRHVADGLRSLLNQWDPIGIVGADGPTDEYRLIVVIHADRGDDLRIISARRAMAGEKKKHAEGQGQDR